MNNICLSGNLTRDLDTRKTNTGLTVATGSLAVRRDFKDKDGNYPTDFFDFSLFGEKAEYLVKYARKGNKLEISGSIQQRKYIAKSGEQRTIYEVIVDKATLCQMPQAEDSKPKAKKSVTPQEAYDEVEVTDDMLPF